MRSMNEGSQGDARSPEDPVAVLRPPPLLRRTLFSLGAKTLGDLLVLELPALVKRRGIGPARLGLLRRYQRLAVLAVRDSRDSRPKVQAPPARVAMPPKPDPVDDPDRVDTLDGPNKADKPSVTQLRRVPVGTAETAHLLRSWQTMPPPGNGKISLIKRLTLRGMKLDLQWDQVLPEQPLRVTQTLRLLGVRTLGELAQALDSGRVVAPAPTGPLDRTQSLFQVFPDLPTPFARALIDAGVISAGDVVDAALDGAGAGAVPMPKWQTEWLKLMATRLFGPLDGDGPSGEAPPPVRLHDVPNFGRASRRALTTALSSLCEGTPPGHSLGFSPTEHIRELCADVKPRQLTILLSRVILGKQKTAIAKEMGICSEAVRQILERLRDRLRRRFVRWERVLPLLRTVRKGPGLIHRSALLDMVGEEDLEAAAVLLFAARRDLQEAQGTWREAFLYRNEYLVTLSMGEFTRLLNSIRAAAEIPGGATLNEVFSVVEFRVDGPWAVTDVQRLVALEWGLSPGSNGRLRGRRAVSEERSPGVNG